MKKNGSSYNSILFLRVLFIYLFIFFLTPNLTKQLNKSIKILWMDGKKKEKRRNKM